MTEISGEDFESTAWRAPEVKRVEPERAPDERRALEEFLDFHRATLLWKCSGLTSPQLKERSVPSSALSLLGIVRHMSEVERGWFRRQANGEDIDSVYGDGPEDFDETENADAAADIATYLAEVDAARAAVAGKDLDFVATRTRHGRERSFEIRWIFLHMVEEYARHNGHADLLRESIDGSTGE
jgi:uncharacterized damage-inducible protein DinB